LQKSTQSLGGEINQLYRNKLTAHYGLNTMKIIINKMGTADGWSRPAQPFKFLHWAKLERLLNWLAGIDTHTFSLAETLISQNLPPGRKIEHATGEELGRATKAAMESHSEKAEEIVRFVFSSLKAHDGEKGEAVIRSVISVISAKCVPNFIRIAVRARPSLTSTVANTAVILVPEKAEEISRAVASVVCC
jgi:hypothetical protein